MIYALSVISFILIVNILNILLGIILRRSKLKKRQIRILERTLVQKLKITEKLYICISDKFSHYIQKQRILKLEKQLLNFLNNLVQNILAGVSLYSYIEKEYFSVPRELKNLLNILIHEKTKRNYKEATELSKELSPSIFAKIFFSIIRSYLDGSKIKDSTISLKKILKDYIQTREAIDASMYQLKAEFLIATILPYFTLFIMNLFYGELVTPIFHYELGRYVLIFFLFLHILGIWIFKKIISIDYKTQLNEILLANYIALLLKTGHSLSKVIHDAEDIGLIERLKTSSFIKKLELLNAKSKSQVFKILIHSYKNGLPSADKLIELADDKLTDFKTNLVLLKNKAQVKVLFPLLFLIFPSSYGIILSPVIIGILQN